MHEEVYARMPNAGERDELALGEDQPVLCMTRVSEDGDGKPSRSTSPFSQPPASGSATT